MTEPRLAAFIRTYDGLFKIYDMGQDWRIIGPNFERWASAWETDRTGSLARAISIIPGADPKEATYT